MAAKKAPAVPGIEEDGGAHHLEGLKYRKDYSPKHSPRNFDKIYDQRPRLGNLPRKRSRRWPLWLATVGVFALLAAKLNARSNPAPVEKKREGGGIGLDEIRDPFSDAESEYLDMGEKKPVVPFAPFMASDALFFEGFAHLKAQNVPFSLEQQEDFALNRSGVPKAWAAYLHRRRTEVDAVDEQGPSEGPINLDWLSDFALQGGVEEDGDRAFTTRVEIRSSDALKVAREVTNRYFGAEPVEEPKESPEAATNRIFNRLIGRLGTGIVSAVTDASRLPNTKYDARSRNLRAEVSLLEIGNEVERLRERQAEALKVVEQARCKLEAGDEDGHAEAELAEAINDYKSLLTCEKHLMTALVRLASRWTDETNKVLSNVASVITSSALADIEEISKLELSVFNFHKMGKKIFGMSDVLQTEARSKNRCRVVEEVASQRVKDIAELMSSIGNASSDEFTQRMHKQSEVLAKCRADSRAILAKKRQELWIADVI